MASFDKDLCKINELIKKSTIIEERIPARYRLTHDLDQSKPHRNITFGERDSKKPHKTILMVGETGTGKTTLINAIVNYMLGVQREDKVWFEITDDQSNNKSESYLTVRSQTSSITVYGFYLQKSAIDLTIIDTPGYGDTRGVDLDKEITVSLLKLSKAAEGVHEVHAVCLVIRASQNQISDRQHYILDAILSLFGRDIAENIVLLFTHSTGGPPSALKAVKKAEIKCAVNEQNQPVFFLFDNCQSDAANEDYETIQERSWKLSHSGMRGFFKFLENIKPKTLKMTQEVLQKREQLEANVSNLQLRVQVMEQKQNELKQTQAALEKNKKYVEDNNDFEYEVEVSYKEKIPMKPKFWHLTKEAMCCPVCEENCHYPGCWWIRDLSWCSVMKHYHCTVCTNKCHSREHVKEAKLYVAKTKKEKRTYEELKNKYDDNIIKVRDGVSVVQKLEKDLQEFEEEKKKLLNEAYYSVETLEMIALNTDSLLTLQHIDVLIEKLKEINEPEKAKKLEDIKKRGGEDNTGGLKYVKKIQKNK